MACIETQGTFDTTTTHDGGVGHGLYGINAGLHGLTVAQCQDVEFSTRWTCRRIKSFGDIWLGVRRHNGAGWRARRYEQDVRNLSGEYECK